MSDPDYFDNTDLYSAADEDIFDRADRYRKAQKEDPADDDDDDEGCEGHESLDGAHMGEVVYCDGTCRPAVTR